MAQLNYILTRLGVPPRSIKHVKTDAYIMAISCRKLASVKAVSEIRFNELHALRNIYEAKSDRTQRFLNSYADMTPIDSNDSVFRFSERGLPLRGNYDTLHRDVPPPAEIPAWRNLSEEEAVSTVLGEGSPYSSRDLRDQARRTL